MNEEVKRLTPSKATVREIYLKSGNICAHPGCTELMIDRDGCFIGELCHIEAANETGARFRQGMSNKERSQASNLVLMCPNHHSKIDNNTEKYTVEYLKKIKAEHEHKYSNPIDTIYKKISDKTEFNDPIYVKNLLFFNKTINDFDLSTEELQELVEDLNTFIADFKNVPVATRHRLGEFVKRAYKLKDTEAASASRSNGLFWVQINDLKDSFGLDDNEIKTIIDGLISYKLAEIDKVEVTEYSETLALFFKKLKFDWTIWLDIAEFCEKTKLEISRFTEDLDFSPLDELN